MSDEVSETSGLADLLDRSFGTGPAGLPTPEHRLLDGRRARRRRRRLLVLATTTAGLLVVAGIALGLPSATDAPVDDAVVAGTDGSPTTALDPPPSATPTTARPRHDDDQRLVSARFPAAFDTDGTVVVKQGWSVVQTVEEPLGLVAPEASLGLVVTDGARTRWMMLTLQRATDENGTPTSGLGTSASADDPGKAYADFADWLAFQVSINDGPPLTPLVTVGADDEVRPGPGAEVVAVQPMPVVEGYSDEGDRMAEVRREGRTWFVVIRGHGADADPIPVDAAILSAPTFAALVEHVRAQSTSGEGLR